MAVIKQLKNFFTGMIIYPKTLTKAVYDENGERLDKILRDTMLAVEDETYNGVEPRDADTLGGKYTSNDIKELKENVTQLNSDFITLNTYSEEEIFTGMYWIDGKRIYRKVLRYNNTLPNNAYTIVGFVNDVSTPIKAYGVFNYNDNLENINITRSLPYTSPFEMGVSVGVIFDNNGNIYTSTGAYGNRCSNLIIVAEYTKNV